MIIQGTGGGGVRGECRAICDFKSLCASQTDGTWQRLLSYCSCMKPGSLFWERTTHGRKAINAPSPKLSLISTQSSAQRLGIQELCCVLGSNHWFVIVGSLGSTLSKGKATLAGTHGKCWRGRARVV